MIARRFAFTAALALTAVLPSSTAAQEPPQPPTFEEEAEARDQKAVKFMNHLIAEEFEEAVQMVEPGLRERMGVAQLRGMWPQLVAQYGRLEKVSPNGRMFQNGYDVVQLLGNFGEQRFHEVRVSFDSSQWVVGFFITN